MKNEKPKLLTDANVRFAINIIVFLLPAFFAYTSLTTKMALIQQELTTIRSNDLAHIEEAITNIGIRNTVADNRQTKIEMDVTRIITTLDLQKSNLDAFNGKK